MSDQNQKAKIDQEMLDFVKKSDISFLMKGKDGKGVPYLKHIFKLYQDLFGKACQGCAGEIPGYIQKIKNYNPKTMETQKNPNQKFFLKSGVIIPIAGTSKAYSEHNITDEVALQLLAENPERKVLFRVVPENLAELIENGLPKADGDTGDNLVKIGEHSFNAAVAHGLLKDAKITTKATTVDGLNKKVASLTAKELEALITVANTHVASITVDQTDDKELELEQAFNAAKERFESFPAEGSDEKTVAENEMNEAEEALKTYRDNKGE